MPIKIKERDIKSICVSDDEYCITYEKETVSALYYTKIHGLAEGNDNAQYDAMCACCGHLFTSEEFNDADVSDFVCPHCKNMYDFVKYDEIPDIVYSMLEDNCEVVIILWSGMQYNFDLRRVWV